MHNVENKVFTLSASSAWQFIENAALRVDVESNQYDMEKQLTHFMDIYFSETNTRSHDRHKPGNPELQKSCM